MKGYRGDKDDCPICGKSLRRFNHTTCGMHPQFHGSSQPRVQQWPSTVYVDEETAIKPVKDSESVWKQK